MKYTIAKKLKGDGARYDGVPRALIEAVVEDTLSYLSEHCYDGAEIGTLDELHMCESCEFWAHPDDMKARAEEDGTLYFCASCFADLNTEVE